VVIRGAQNQVIDETNPTPDLDRDQLANDFADVTRSNLHWDAEILGVVPCGGSSYRLIRRTAKDRTVVSAICVKGNTTFVITMLGMGEARFKIDAEMPTFEKLLRTSSLEEKKMY
jgi:hypothetical protein